MITFNFRDVQAPCQLCGKPEELRPYGPNGEWICFDCGMEDEITTDKRFREVVKKQADRDGVAKISVDGGEFFIFGSADPD